MRQLTDVTKTVFLPMTLTLALLTNSGCSLGYTPASIGREYYFIGICRNGDVVQFTDLSVLECTGAVKDTLRRRMTNARWARTGGSVIQVVTAAVSAMLTGTTGSGAIEVATILSGTSAIIPDVSEIIGARQRAEAYSEGVKWIEEAEARYCQQIAELQDGQVNDQKLTPAGAALYASLVGALHLVEARLTGQLPTVEDLRKAKPLPLNLSGKTATRIKTSGEPTRVQMTTGGPAVSAMSSDLSVARVALEESGMAVDIIGVSAGKAVVTVRNESGGWAMVRVGVEE